MAQLSVNGLDGLELSMAELASLPDDVLDEMLLAEADVIESAQRAVGKAYGVYRTGQTVDAITHGKIEKKDNKRSLSVYPRGKNTNGDSNAEVAFINEYGKRQQARPFIRDANEQAEEQAAEAAEAVYDKWLKQHDL